MQVPAETEVIGCGSPKVGTKPELRFSARKVTFPTSEPRASFYKELKVQSGKTTCLKSHSNFAAWLGFELKASCFLCS